MSSVRRQAGESTLYVKGASDSVLGRCTSIETVSGVHPLTAGDRTQLQERIDTSATEGLRVLALAVRSLTTIPESIEDAERDLTIVGFVAMADPPREEVSAALAATRTAGIRTYILTGDAASTALSIAGKVGLTQEGSTLPVVEGAALLGMADTELQEVLTKPAAIFCRVSPEDKLRIVELLKKRGEIVAVTGDGVNDAPALKSAAIGVAMGRTGTDVAKNAAEIILLDDSFATLVDAVHEGRTIFRNMRKNVISSLTANGGELFATLFGFGIMALGTSQPIVAVQILAIDLLAEMAPLTLLTLDPAPKDIMHERPRARNEHLVSVCDISAIFAWGALIGAIAVGAHVLFLWESGQGLLAMEQLNPALYVQATTVTYLTIGFCQYANILSRRWNDSVFSRQTLENPAVIASMGITMVGIAGLMYTPVASFLSLESPPLWGWALAFGGGIIYLGIWEVKKLLTRRSTLQHAYAGG